MYKVLIVENQTEQCNALNSMLMNYNNNFQIFMAKDYFDGLSKIQSNKFDIIFLDIKLDDSDFFTSANNGVQLGIKIRSIFEYEYVPIIFITAFPELIHEALTKTSCFSYILKPYTCQDIFNCLDKLLHSPLVPPPSFAFTNFWGGRIHLPESSIFYFTPSLNHRIQIYTDSGCYETSEYSLTQLEQTLRHNFYRCHRKYLINLQWLTNYDRTRHIVYVNDKAIPVGRNYKSKLDEIWRMKNV